MDKAILRKWLKAGYIEDRTLLATEAGTPQGGIISPVLSNWALDGLQQQLAVDCGQIRHVGGKPISPKINFVRYADDFIITGPSKEVLEEEVLPVVERFMSERGLTLSPAKTKITHVADGFDFLGQNIRKYDGKLLITPAKKNVHVFLTKVRSVVKSNGTTCQHNLIGLLNPMIKGWTDYHRHVVSKKIFARIDSAIWQVLWRWCCRRHPNKGRYWIKHRYFRCSGDRTWVFAAPTGKYWPDGKAVVITLRLAADVPIRRHTKIKSNANPFDPAWECYFEHRHGMAMFNNLEGRKKLIRLWFAQQGLCPHCAQRITKETGWHVHHLIRRVDGGSSAISNLTMVHPTCHTQIHHLDVKVAKPAPSRGL